MKKAIPTGRGSIWGRAGSPQFNLDYSVILILLIRSQGSHHLPCRDEAPKEIFPMRVPSPELAPVDVELSGICI